MKRIDTYGLTVDLESLEKAASETRTWPTKRMWDALFYDTRDGKVWLSPESEDSWSELADGVLRIMPIEHHMSAQSVMDAIKWRVDIEKEEGFLE